jgi:hypothetical protein
MPYAFEQLRVHFIEHTVRRVWHEGDGANAVINALPSEVQQELTDADHTELRDHVNYLLNETEKLLRSRIPHDVAPTDTAIELWGYQQIQPLTPDIYVRHNQPTQQDFDQHFQSPPGEVWAWNVIYTLTGPYYGVQTNAEGTPATHYQDLGAAHFVLDLATALKSFKGFEVLGDLTSDNIDGFTLEFDECKAMVETLRNQQDEVKAALTPLLQGSANFHQPDALISTLTSPLESALNKGIAQFKRGRLLQN